MKALETDEELRGREILSFKLKEKAVFTTPEAKWGYDYIAEKYQEDPDKTREKIFRQVRKFFSVSDEKDLQKVMGIRRPGESRR